MFTSFVLAAVTATSPALPVQLEACEILQPIVAPQTGDLGGLDTIRGSQLRIRFTDTASQPIQKIVFSLNGGTSVTDTGTFSPGVPIDHRIDIDVKDATACAVESVTLVDGTKNIPTI